MERKKVLTALALIFILVLAGIGFYRTVLLVPPPEINLNVGNSTFEGADGSNCWRRSPFSSRCVDTISPAGLVEMTELDNISVPGNSYVEPDTVGYREPEEYSYRLMNYNNSVLEQGNFTDRTLFTRNGSYILEISAKWDRGDANYVFPVVLGDNE